MGHGTNRVEDMASPNNGTTAPATANARETIMEIHSVCLPPKKTAFQKLKKRFGDVFFPDDPLERFRNQTWRNRVILGLQSLFPIFTWGSQYDLKLLRSDVVSGLTIASLAIPQGISYAKLANLPPIVGLCKYQSSSPNWTINSSFVPPLIYSVLGSSKHLAVGPVSIASLVMGSMLSESVSPTQDSILYLKLAFTSTFFAGLFQASLGLLRLGFVIDFLSKPTLIGFTAGAAVIVSLQQLKGLLGIVHFTGKMQFIPVMSSVFSHRSEWSWETILMGLGFLAILLTTRHISMRKPKLFWISAASPLASVVISTLLVFLIRNKTHAISFIGHLPKGLNPPSSNMLYFSGTHLALAIKTGSFSRSAVNYNAGAKTAVSNIVMASAVLVTLLFLMPLFYYTPNLILAAIILTAVIGLIDYQAAYKLWKVDKFDFFTCMCSFFGVLLVSVPLGLAIAVGVSVLKILLHVTRPNTLEFGNIQGTQIYQSVKRYREASRIPGFLILAVESPIYFANSTYLQERILRWTREEEARIKENNGSTLKCIILDMTAVSSIDTNGIEALFELRRRLEKQSLQLVLVNPVGSVMEKLHKSKIIESLGLSGLYLTVGEAVADLSSTWKAHGQP
ncbi:hypothetical protein IGI04_003535 [Brassica rapa subsp. trilocularis]|uniref:STAS domain-containing protein n=1 Tax=Brassica rapa subsp. trilocularis TaxID=1813537 RepID=A0ABQ7NYN4_BRACM|nr:hypothetical protein IGI04_003535 [Brassica rapa subsp. trilocularis]